MNRSAENLNALRRAAYRVARPCWDVEAYVTREDYENLLRYQRATGLDWDAVNKRFVEWKEDTDNE